MAEAMESISAINGALMSCSNLGSGEFPRGGGGHRGHIGYRAGNLSGGPMALASDRTRVHLVDE